MSIVTSIYRRVIKLSPHIEIMMRKLYWNNVKRFSQYKIDNHIPKVNNKIDLNKISSYLRKNGVKQNDILIIHSAFSPFKQFYKGEEVLEVLLDVVPNGTIAMPAIRYYEEDEPYYDYIDKSYEQIISTYDVHNSKITSGYLPYLMTKDSRAYISRCPHNPLVAIGADAKKMMESNIDSNFITAHGNDSCWDYCVKNDAWSIGLGIPIEGFLTIFHWTQETGEWPVKDWFFPRKFKIIDGSFQKDIIFNERVHKWTKYYAETNFNKDMLHEGIIKYANIDGIPILMTKTSELIKFLQRKNKINPTYPYCIPKKFYSKYYKDGFI